MNDFRDQSENRVAEEGTTSKEAPATQADDNDVAALRGQIKQVQAKADEWLDQYRRSAAEFANYRKRQERDREQQQVAVKVDVVRRLFPIIDDLELALGHLPEGLNAKGWTEGLSLILRKMKGVLSEYGVEPIEALGKPFDPNYHEAVLQEPSNEYPAGVVMEEMRPGYRIGDQVVRATQVKVSGGPQESNKR
jgi:molecular chaperone GrpE